MDAFVPLAQPDLSGNERKYLLEAFDSGYLTHVGEWEERFEKQFSLYVGRPSLAVSSGTAALHIALMTLNVGPGDEVIVPNMTFGATAAVVSALGAKPVFVDCEEDFTINWNHVPMKLTRRTKAVIAVHLYGNVSQIPSCPVPVIEDSCEALGMVEPKSHLSCFSFYGNKVMTTGEGGMLSGNLGNARHYRNGGFTPDYDMLVSGLNYRMTNLQAAIGCAQLERIDDLLSRRLENAALYASLIKGQGKWLFVADSDDAVGLTEHLKKSGVDCRPVFRPLHMTKAFRRDGKFPVSVRLWERGVCLPTGPHVSSEQIKKISEMINEHHDLCRTPDSGRKLAKTG